MTISAIRPVYLSSIYRTDLTSLEEARRIKIAGYYRQWMLAPKMAMFSGCVSGVFLVCWLLVQVFSHEDKPRGDPPFRTTWGVMGKEEVDQTIYRPAFYWLRENDVIPAVEYYDLMNCTMVFAEWLNRAQNYKMSQPSPTKLPKILKNQFTLNGLLQWTSQPDDSKFDRSHVVWTRDQIEDLVLKDVVEFNELDGQARAMYRAMENNDINGNKILIFGTERTPWIESFALKEGALEVLRTGPVNITVENYPYVQYKNPMDIARKYHKYLDYFDVAASFSLESYGFGRFDPLNPNGDLLEIQKTYCMLKDKGILLLGLPIGWDNVVWNKKRIYGRLRLGMVAAAFDVIDMYYYEETIPIVVEEFDKTSKASSSISKRVVLVLKKRHSTTGRF